MSIYDLINTNYWTWEQMCPNEETLTYAKYYQQGGQGWLDSRNKPMEGSPNIPIIGSSELCDVLGFFEDKNFTKSKRLWNYLYTDETDRWKGMTKLDRIKQEDNFSYGHRFEPSARATYMWHIGREIDEDTEEVIISSHVFDTVSLQNPLVCPGFSASTDGLVYSLDEHRKISLEVKAHRTKNDLDLTMLWYYIPQVQCEMFVWNTNICHFGSFIPRISRFWKVRKCNYIWRYICLGVEYFRKNGKCVPWGDRQELKSLLEFEVKHNVVALHSEDFVKSIVL